jgi:hypothetical protein
VRGIAHTVGFRLLQEDGVFGWAEVVFCTDLGDIMEIGIGEFGVEEVEGCVSCMEDKCLLSVMDRVLLLGSRCIDC